RACAVQSLRLLHDSAAAPAPALVAGGAGMGGRRLNEADPAAQRRGYPAVANVAVISSRLAGSSIVGGTRYSTPSAIFLIVPRRILPERVFGRRCTTIASRNAATGPIRSRTMPTSSSATAAAGRPTPALKTMSPSGT